MPNKNTIILFIISILFFSLSLLGVYIYGQTTIVWHSADEIMPGAFQIGDYKFPGSSRVGIGTDNLSNKLNVVSDEGGEFTSFQTSNTGNSWVRIQNGVTGMNLGIGNITPHPYIWSWSNLFFIGNDGNPTLFISGMGNGNVGIGTTTPCCKLDVNGVINGSTILGNYIQANSWVTSYKNQFQQVKLYQHDIFPAIEFAGSSFAGVNEVYFLGNDYSSDPNVRVVQYKFRNLSGGDTAQIHVNTLYASHKDFAIDHPTKPGMKLIHGAIEGPENAVYYRGEAQLKNGKTVVKLPDYFEALTRKKGRTVLLTCKDGWSPIYVEGGVKDGKFIVKSAWKNSNQKFYWEVKAVRADIAPLKIEEKASKF